MSAAGPKKTTSGRAGKAATAKKTPPKKAPAKKPAAKQPPAKGSAAKKAPAKGSTAKKAPAKKAPAKKAPAKKAPAARKPLAKPASKQAGTRRAVPTPGAGATHRGRARKKTVICELSGFEVTPSPANLSAKTLERLRHKLIEEKQRLLHQADELAAEAEQLAREREAGDTQFDEESGEGDTVNIERERDLLLSASARQVVEEIDEALIRIKKGSYGVCKYAGRKIPLERLEAIPWANVCVDCKARAERRR